MAKDEDTSDWHIGELRREMMKKLEPIASELNLPREYLEESITDEYLKVHLHHPKINLDWSPKRIIDRALLLQSLNKTAREIGIDPRYLKGPGYEQAYEIDKNKKGAYKRILNRAIELQKKEKGLTSKFVLFIISIGIIIEGLFLLSSNITGNVIGNFTNSTSNIFGAILFVGGLVATFFLAKR